MKIVKRVNASFAAIPARAAGDRRLKEIHHRTLIAVSLHDRMSLLAGGQGCWKAVRKLAELANANYTSFCEALNELIDWGYIKIEANGRFRNSAVYRVIFTEDNRGEDGSPDLGIVRKGGSTVERYQDVRHAEYISPKRSDIISLNAHQFGKMHIKGDRNADRYDYVALLNFIEGELKEGKKVLSSRTEAAVLHTFKKYLDQNEEISCRAAHILERAGTFVRHFDSDEAEQECRPMTLSAKSSTVEKQLRQTDNLMHEGARTD